MMKLTGYVPREGDRVRVLHFGALNGAAFVGSEATAHYELFEVQGQPVPGFQLYLTFDPPVCTIPAGATSAMMDAVYEDALKFWEEQDVEPEFTREEMGYISEVWVDDELELELVKDDQYPPLQPADI